eukprot:scaffold21214_cov101-Isochrysis_galbana.AAC.3
MAHNRPAHPSTALDHLAHRRHLGALTRHASGSIRPRFGSPFFRCRRVPLVSRRVALDLALP